MICVCGIGYVGPGSYTHLDNAIEYKVQESIHNWKETVSYTHLIGNMWYKVLMVWSYQ